MGDGSYLHRVEALERRFHAGTCGSGLCLKCVILGLPAVDPSGERVDSGSRVCDGQPMTSISEILDSIRNSRT
jgi:hypothetical protein